ncbi:MAG: hypothetical protein EZS28_013674 [Streblomastix strix]|uniref:Uncharacterized protein n=1 Tax=Streblomastix strix TaxID=222440 RepID=A0A5J4W8Y5_9EUKA|nr:MAG: hypothetical protein EZS28_013674 [Streblomastix strix]
MSSDITTLGAATGGSNAITDISIDGNVLTPAKNKNFIDTDYDQSISSQKTFNSTIHSVGIMVQKYVNSSVGCANRRVRSIADILSASYSKSEDDALLLLKADKTQLIDSYVIIETYNFLNNKCNTGVSYNKVEEDAIQLLKADKTQLIYSYTKSEDDALLLLKVDKTQLIDSYTKGETNNLQNNNADTGVSYTKGEDDALQLLKANKTQLIDSRIKGEINNLLDNKANQSTTYAKTETDKLISYIDMEDVDLTDYYNKTKTDEFIGENADTTKQSNYVTLGASQTITANNTFNNAGRFVSLIDGISTITGSSFIKSGADNIVVLLGAGGTKPISEFIIIIDDSNYVKNMPIDEDYITLGAVKSEFVSSIYSGSISSNLTASQFIKSSGTDQQVLLANGTTKPLYEFAGTPTDLSNYYTKTQTYLKTKTYNKNVRLEGSIQQTIAGRLKYINEFGGTYDETQDPVENTYLTMSEVDAKLTNYVNTTNNQSINGTKTFNANVNATGFVKTGKDDTSVLLAGGGDRLLSSFSGIEDLTSSGFSSINSAVIQYKLIKIGNLYVFALLANGGNYNVGTFNPDYLVQDDIAVIKYILFPNHTVDKGGYISITHSIELTTCKSTTNTYIYCASATWVK